MFTQRFALLLLLVIAAQANIIKNPQVLQKEVQLESPNLANEVPVAVEQGNEIPKVAKEQEAVVSFEAEEQQIKLELPKAKVPQSLKPKHPQVAAAAVEEKVSNVIVKEEIVAENPKTEAAAILEKQEKASQQKEQLNEDNVISKIEAAPIETKQQKVSNVNAQQKVENPGKVEAAAIPSKEEKVSQDKVAAVQQINPANVISKIEATPIETKQEKVPVKQQKLPNVISGSLPSKQDKVIPKEAAVPVPVPVPIPAKQQKQPVVLPKIEVAAAQKEHAKPQKLAKEKYPAVPKPVQFQEQHKPAEKPAEKLEEIVGKLEKYPAVPKPVQFQQQHKPAEKPAEKLEEIVGKLEKYPAVPKPLQLQEQQKTAAKLEEIVGKLEGSDNKVVNQAQAESRTKVGYPDYFYIVDPDANGNGSSSTTEKPTGVTHKHTHSHEHHYYKPALFPFPPPFVSFLPEGGSGSHGYKYHSNGGGSGNKGHYNNSNNGNYHYNKHGSSGSSGSGDKGHYGGTPGFYPLPLLPIPFWKPSSGHSSSQKYNSSMYTDGDQLYNFKPTYTDDYSYSPFYMKERRAPAGGEQSAQSGNQPGLVLIGHIYLHIRPQANKPEAEAAPKPNPSEEPENKDNNSEIKIDEPFQNSQLLLQPVVYTPSNQQNKESANPLPNQIKEIYRSLHLVHPSNQQRSASSAEGNDDGAVLFAVEIPKPIYRFFKSVFGVFSY